MVSWRSHMTLFQTYPPWWASQVVLGQRSCLPMQETEEPCVQSLSQEDPLEEGIATHSSILAGRIPWTEEPGGLQFIWSQRVGHDWSNLAHMHESPLISPLWSMPLLFSLWVRLISFPSRILELWNFGLPCFFFFPLALLPLSSVSLQTGIHIKLSVCFIVNQTVLISFKICSFFILPYLFFNI